MSSTSTTQTISMDTILEQAMRGLIIQECEAPIEAPAPAACVSQSSTSSSSTSTQQQANTSVSFSLVNPFATIPLPPSQPSHPHWKRPPPQSCALSSVHADVNIDSYNATVNVTQTYNNHSDRWCEAVYVFPLDEQSAVSAFRAEFDDGTIIRGIVKEKAQAQREYRDAIRQNKQAALMQQQQHQENIFTCHIGNMRPFQSVRIVITYITQLGLEAGSKARFVMPQTIAPKYSMTLPYHAKNQVHTNTPHNNAATTTWSHQHIQQTNSTANDITIHINMPSAITDITSPSHDAIIIKHIDEGHDGKRATVQFNVNSDSSRGLDKDVVLLISQSQPYTAHALVEEDPITHSRVVQLTFIQPVMDMLAASQLHCEIIFVVDRSGSMSGTSMRAVIETLTIAMRSLPTNARFNIISFGDRYSKLWSSSQIYTETTMQQASKHIQSMQANMGGTELYACLNDILSAPITSGYPRQIFLLTDGQVSDTLALIRLVNAKASQQRLFTFGIGDGVDRHLCTSLAAAGHGEAEFVSVSASNNTHYNSQAHSFNNTSSTSSTQGDIATKVINQLSRALQPCLSDVRVDWTSFVQAHGLDMSSLVQIPATPTAIFPASRYFIYATLPPAASTSASTLPSTYNITVSASSNADVSGPQLAMSMNIAATSTLSTGNTLHKLAARARIHELDQSMLQPENSRNVDGIKQQIIHLAVSHQLVSSYTSFIAVSDTPAKPMYECHVYDPFLMEQQQQQQQQLYGGGGVRGGVGYGMAAPMAAPMMSFQNHSFRCASASTGGGARGGSVLKMKRAPSPMSYVPAAARSRSRSRSRSRDRSSAPSASYAELSRSRSSAPSTSYADLHMDEEEEEEAEMGFCLFDDGNTLDAVTEKENASTFNMDKKKKKSKESKEIIAAIQRAGQLKSKEISTSGPVNMTSTGKPDTHSILLALISLQSAMGHFDLTSQLIAHIQSVIGSKLDVDECIKTLRSTYGLSDQVIATILSVHLLTTYCSAHVAEARMIIVKAQLYLQKQTSTTPAITQATNQVAQTLVF